MPTSGRAVAEDATDTRYQVRRKKKYSKDGKPDTLNHRCCTQLYRKEGGGEEDWGRCTHDARPGQGGGGTKCITLGRTKAITPRAKNI